MAEQRRDANGWPVDLPKLRVQWSGWRGRIVANDHRGEKETEMQNDRDRQQRSSGQGNGAKAQPWNVFRVKGATRANGEAYDDFQPCGVAWPLRDGEGFSLDVHFQLPEGSRLVIKPRKGGAGGGR